MQVRMSRLTIQIIYDIILQDYASYSYIVVYKYFSPVLNNKELSEGTDLT